MSSVSDSQSQMDSPGVGRSPAAKLAKKMLKKKKQNAMDDDEAIEVA